MSCTASPPSHRWLLGLALLGLSVLSPLLLAGCSPSGRASSTASFGAGSQTPVTLQLSGSSTIAPLMSEIGKRFESTHPGVRVQVQMGGSSQGVADARRGIVDIGMVSRAPNEDERDLHFHPIARDGVCVIVHAENPLRELSDQQIARIFTGEIDNWKSVGGPDAKIVVVNKAQGRSTLEVFTTYFEVAPRTIEADVVIGDNEQGIKTVAGNAHAIGYVSVGTAQFDRDAGVPIRLLPIDGVGASVASVARGEFPLSRTLHLVTRDRPTGLAKDLIGFVGSTEVHDLIRELAFVPYEN